MNLKKVVGELKNKYPGKEIIVNTPENPTEVVCETKPGKDRSEAVAVIDASQLHYHQRLTEVYQVAKGELVMFLDGEKRVLKKGEEIEIKPGVRHRAVGEETWVKVYSVPGWTPEDYFLV